MAEPIDTARIIEQLKAGAPAVLAQYPVRLAYVYGSVARGAATALSDVDVGVLFDETLSGGEQFDLALEITARLQEIARTRLTVDARIMNEMPILLLGTIVTEGVCFYSRDESYRLTYETAIRDEYAARLPAARREAREYLLRVLEQGFGH